MLCPLLEKSDTVPYPAPHEAHLMNLCLGLAAFFKIFVGCGRSGFWLRSTLSFHFLVVDLCP